MVHRDLQRSTPDNIGIGIEYNFILLYYALSVSFPLYMFSPFSFMKLRPVDEKMKKEKYNQRK